MALTMPGQRKPDYLLALIVFGLVIFGLIMISSASIVRSYEITDGKSNNYFLIRQAIALVIGIGAWIFFAALDYKKLKKYAFGAFIISLVLLVITIIPKVGTAVGGAQRWIAYGPIFFQPAELVKLTLIIYLAYWLESRSEKMSNFFLTLIPFLIILAVPIAIIFIQPDIGTSSVIILTALIMFFVAGANLWQIGLLIPLSAAIIWILIKSAPYRMARILAFINPQADQLGISYHIQQAIIAIGSGGLLGLGFGQSKQKYSYLPEAHTDSIFAIIAEELGFLRALLVLIAFGIIAWRGFLIAKRASDNFGRYLATGITAWFTVQAIINIAAMLGMIPLTGVPLPFVSYSGTSLVISLAAVGILMNISRHRMVE